MLLAVNGTLMRGLELNRNMVEAGARFVREARTAPVYRLWSIEDRYPAMLRVKAVDGASIAVEVWDIGEVGLVRILQGEPPGLTIGKVLLYSGEQVLGVLAEAYLVEGKPDITRFGGWRQFMKSR